MQRIDLCMYYPWYPIGSFIDLPDEIVATLDEFERQMATYKRRAHWNKAHYSLDCNDGIELLAIYRPLTPEEIFERKQTILQLYAAIASLPNKQAKRIYAHFFLNMSKAEIARAEGVNEGNIRKSIARGVESMRKFFDCLP